MRVTCNSLLSPTAYDLVIKRRALWNIRTQLKQESEGDHRCVNACGKCEGKEGRTEGR
jgi:hypothetical protein